LAQESQELAQWTLDVTVYHGRDFGHRIRARVLNRRGGWHHVGTWSWKGIGVPSELIAEIEARVASVITEHLVTRYGISVELPLTWEDDPGPF